jgi:hypothetical protein
MMPGKRAKSDRPARRRIHVVLMDVTSVASVKEARDQVAAKLQRTYYRLCYKAVRSFF